MTGGAEARTRGEEIFDELAVAYADLPQVARGPMFSSDGLSVRGKYFAFVGTAGRLIVKLSRERIDELATDGTASQLEMRGRAMREWADVPLATDDASRDTWRRLVDEAYRFVDAITP